MLASLAAHALPTISTGLTTGLLSGGTSKAISGDGLFLHKYGLVEGDELFLRHGNEISDGASLLMGEKSPFKDIPILGYGYFNCILRIYKT